VIGLAPLADVLDMMSPDTEEDDTLDECYTVRDVLNNKRQSPGYASLLEQVRANGITVPVLIRTLDGQPWLADGHHRVATAVDLGLDVVPWTDVPLGIEPHDFNPHMRDAWGGYRGRLSQLQA
jgi:hypothetical protein